MATPASLKVSVCLLADEVVGELSACMAEL